MTLKAEQYWLVGDLLECIEHHPSIEKVNFCLLLLANNPLCLTHLIKVRINTDDPVSLERSKLIEGIIRFTKGEIQHAANMIGEINRKCLERNLKDNHDGWDEFYLAIHADLVQIFSETPRHWVEGQRLFEAGKLHPICVLGDSHVLAAGWGYGTCWFSRPFYIPGIQMYQLASRYHNRSKSGLINTMQSLDRANHIILSVGEIDYRLTTKRNLAVKNRYEAPQITSLAELNRVIDVEKNKIFRAVEFVSNSFSPGQKCSWLSIPLPKIQRLRSASLSEVEIELETKLIAHLNDFLRMACEKNGLGFIDTEQEASDQDWFSDGVHKKHSFHKQWLEQYANGWV